MLSKDPLFTVHDYAIGGKMVVGKAILDDSYSELMRTDSEARQRVKEDLIHQMATFILENNLVEFTQFDDPVTFRKHVAVRACLAPNDQVKILRLANKI
jgi:hypothetical protein